jgi:type IV pilus assembly protein PilB
MLATDVTAFLTRQYRIPTVNLDELEIQADVLALIPVALCTKLTVLPVSRAGSSLIVAMANAYDAAAVDELKQATGYNIEPVLASASVITAAIAKYYNPK